MRERGIEQHLVRRVNQMGGMCVKLAPTIIGIPDRLILLPGRPIKFVEVKQPDGRISAAQKVIHERLSVMGWPVAVVWSTDDVNALLEEL